jgi:peptidyl-prolyl cis-trans isomerase C
MLFAMKGALTMSGPRLFFSFCFSLSMLASVSAISADTPLDRIELTTESGVFARQGSAVITQADFDAYLSRMPEEHRGGFLLSNERIGQVLQNFVLVRLLAAEGMEKGLLDDEVVGANLFQAAMVYLAEEHRQRYLAERMLDDYTDAARELYLTRPERFRSEPTVSFTHILVWRGRGRGELEAMESIFSIYDRLRDGADFDELVLEHSDDPSLEDNQGRFARVDLAELEDNFARAVAMMQPGQISEPVLTDYGWHIIRLDEKHEAEQRGWEDVRELAITTARERHQNDLLERLYRRLLNADSIEVTPGAVEDLLTRYGVRDAGRPTTEAVTEHARDQD